MNSEEYEAYLDKLSFHYENVRKERDRYRVALSEIMNEININEQYCDTDQLKNIAGKALEGKE